MHAVPAAGHVDVPAVREVAVHGRLLWFDLLVHVCVLLSVCVFGTGGGGVSFM